MSYFVDGGLTILFLLVVAVLLNVRFFRRPILLLALTFCLFVLFMLLGKIETVIYTWLIS